MWKPITIAGTKNHHIYRLLYRLRTGRTHQLKPSVCYGPFLFKKKENGLPILVFPLPLDPVFLLVFPLYKLVTVQ